MKRLKDIFNIIGLILISPLLLVLALWIGCVEIWEEIEETYSTKKGDDL